MKPKIAQQIMLAEATTAAGISIESAPESPTPIELVLTESLGEYWPTRLPRLEARLTDCDSSAISIEAVSATLAQAEWEEAAQCLGELLSIVQRRGGRCLNLRFPALYGRPPAPPFDRYQSAFNHAFHMLAQARFDAEATGVAVALEVASGDFLRSPVEARELIDSANSWSIGACVDLSHIGDDACACDWLRTLRGRVRCVRTANPKHELLKETLEALGFDGTVVALK